MKGYTVVFTPGAEDQFAELYGYIADEATPVVAERYTCSTMTNKTIATFCFSNINFPSAQHLTLTKSLTRQRGMPRQRH
jgi:hypothetical protein